MHLMAFFFQVPLWALYNPVFHNHFLGSQVDQCQIPAHLVEEQMHFNQLK